MEKNPEIPSAEDSGISSTEDWGNDKLARSLSDRKRLFLVVPFQNEREAQRDIAGAVASGADGVFLKGCHPHMAGMTAKLGGEIETTYPGLWLGVNFHGYSALGVANTLAAMSYTPRMVWLQSPRTTYGNPLEGIDLARELILKRARKIDTFTPVFFGTTRYIPGNSMKQVRQIIRRILRKVYVAVVPIDFEDELLLMKLGVMRVASGNGLLAFDGVMTPTSAERLRDYGDVFLVPARYLGKPCDWKNVEEIAEIVHAQ